MKPEEGARVLRDRLVYSRVRKQLRGLRSVFRLVNTLDERRRRLDVMDRISEH